ncbi:hypothetical protein [Pantoea sp. App145]|uniref:hypothetical protein n=1 Tax=Pantoea sp. App145 TaxID=3071567 RepID=UPI003A8066A0
MNKPFKIATSIIVIIVAVLAGVFAYYWPITKLEFEGSAHYTEQNKRLYEHFTPDILKNMPRISDNYQFAFQNISGPAALIYEVRFNGTTDTSKISAYLESLGYIKQSSCSIEGECWRGNIPEEEVAVGAVEKTNVVIVSVIH